jgi:putative nucleotidyltransferase with HDIG domain
MSAQSKTRILFVDDEPLLRELLRLSVEQIPGDWDPRFAASGEEALRLLAQEHFDLVVSDMHMPGISGSELLNEVMEHYPATSRIILSGYADQSEVMHCVGATHQFLVKPCKVGHIKATLSRIRALRELLPNEAIQKVLGQRTALPTIPEVYFQLLKALQDPDGSTDRLTELLASDPGLTAKILQLVNSAFFGAAREISSMEEAVQLLGFSTIRSLALAQRLFSGTALPASAEWSAERLWHHSMRVGAWARKIARLHGADALLQEQAFTAGMLHDIGQLLLAEQLDRGYLEVVKSAQNRPLVELEREQVGASHAEIGAYLLNLWGLPSPLVEAVALHHTPSLTPQQTFSPLTAIHVANGLEHAAQSPTPQAALSRLDCRYLDQLALGSQIEAWREALSAE